MRYIYFFVFFYVCVLADAQDLYDPNRHTTGPNRGWISCDPAENPQIQNELGHWITYDFGQSRSIRDLQLWNLNEIDRLTDGLKKVSIKISDNGTAWESIGEFSLEMGSGSSYYCGKPIGVFEPFQTRFLLINALENYGGSCYGLSEVKFMLTNSSLPVTLINQSVICNEKGSRTISWVTEKEINNDYYAIQSSEHGLLWKTIHTKKGKNNQGTQHYNWIHNGVGSTDKYYRIQQFDRDGIETSFDAIPSNCDWTGEPLSVWPNPIIDNVNVIYHKRSSSSAMLKIVDMQGKIVRQFSINPKEQNYQDRISLQDLKAGNYVLFIEENGAISSKNIQKL